jgi:hypothetical protein
MENEPIKFEIEPEDVTPIGAEPYEIHCRCGLKMNLTAPYKGNYICPDCDAIYLVEFNAQ